MTRQETIDAILNPISHLGATDHVTATDLRRVVDIMVNGPAHEPEVARVERTDAEINAEIEAKDGPTQVGLSVKTVNGVTSETPIFKAETETEIGPESDDTITDDKLSELVAAGLGPAVEDGSGATEVEAKDAVEEYLDEIDTDANLDPVDEESPHLNEPEHQPGYQEE